MSGYIPAHEFWLAGAAFWPAVALLFTTVLAVISVGRHSAYWPAICVLPIVVGGYWLSMAQSESEKVKPQRDYAYFTTSSDRRDNDGHVVNLIVIATGPLKDVSVAIQTAEEREKGSRIYIFGGRFSTISEGATLLKFPLPTGDYWIDVDQPAAPGQILEHLQIEKIDSKFIPKITVIRKTTRESLIPPPETISFYGAIVLSLICLAFISFASTLIWVSSGTTSRQVTVPITQSAVTINNQIVFGRSVGSVFILDSSLLLQKIAINHTAPKEQPLNLAITPAPDRRSIGIFDYVLVSYGHVTFLDENSTTVGEIRIEPKERYGTHRARLEIPLSAVTVTQTSYPGFGASLNLFLAGWKAA